MLAEKEGGGGLEKCRVGKEEVDSCSPKDVLDGFS